MSLFPPDDWVTVGHSPLEIVAEMMRSRLEAEGIDAVLRGNKASGAAGVINELNLTWDNPLGGVEVRVHESDAEAAREILAEVDVEEVETESELTNEEEFEGENFSDKNERLEKSVRPVSGIQIYFQIFSALLIGLWIFAAVSFWSQNITIGLVCGVVACALFLLSARRPGK